VKIHEHLKALLPHGGIPGLLHWIFLAMAVLLPLAFSLNLMPAFSPPKLAIFVTGSAGLLLLAALWLRKTPGVTISLQSEHVYLLCFIAWLFLSTLWAPDFFTALAEFLPFLSGALVWFIYALFYEHEDRDNRKQFALIHVFVLSGLIQAVLVLIQYFGIGFQFFSELGGTWRVLGAFGNSTLTAEFLVAVFFLALNLLHHERHRRVYSAAAFFIFLAIIATWSRSGILLLFIGLLLYACIFARVKRQPLKVFFQFIYQHVKSYFFLLCFGLVMILVIYPFLSMDRGLFRQTLSFETISKRAFIWEHTLEALVSNLPFGTGVGGYPAAYADAQYRYFSGGKSFGLGYAASINKNAHNDLLQFAVEIGIGCIFIVLFFGRILRKGMRDFSHDDLSIGTFTALTILILSSFVNFPMRVSPTLYLLMILAALASTHRQTKEEKTIKEIHIKRVTLRTLIPAAAFFVFACIWSCGVVLSALVTRLAVEKAEAEPESALRSLRYASAFNPAHAWAPAKLAALAYQAGDTDRAFSASKKSLGIFPQAEAWRIQALLAEGQGRREDALEYWRRRCYTWRFVPAYAADYTRALLDAGLRGEAVREASAFNEMAARLGLDSGERSERGEWGAAAARVNGAAVMARLEPGTGRLFQESPGDAPAPAPRLTHPVRSFGAIGEALYAADESNIFVIRDGKTSFLESHGGDFAGFAPMGGGLAYVSSGALQERTADGGIRVLARGLEGVACLAAEGDSCFAGMNDGRLLLVQRYGSSLLARFDRAPSAVAVGRDRIFIALEGGTVLFLDRAATRTERVLDATDGIAPGHVSSLALLEDALLIALQDAGVYSFDLVTGSLRRNAVRSGGAHILRGGQRGIRQLLPISAERGNAAAGKMAFALAERSLLLLSKTGHALLELEGGPFWPESVSSALLYGSTLAVSGPDGIQFYTRFDQALAPYAEAAE